MKFEGECKLHYLSPKCEKKFKTIFTEASYDVKKRFYSVIRQTVALIECLCPLPFGRAFCNCGPVQGGAAPMATHFFSNFFEKKDYFMNIFGNT